ncbi:MAG TPA: glycosyltransferase family 4 protein [Firmicutes bacterium]|nr:glycosyltransferase family 4 protein [Bacillota bacterium]
MDVTVVIEHRYLKTPDGCVWTPTVFGYSFWLRYLDVFDGVKVVARVFDLNDDTHRRVLKPDSLAGLAGAGFNERRNNWVRADGQGVSFVPVPYYQGPLGYLLKWARVKRAVRLAVPATGTVILRIQSQLASIMEPALLSTGHPFGVEVTGDPWDELAPGSMKQPFRCVFRILFTRQVKAQCRSACAVAYVTKEALQRRYPASPNAFTTHYSSVELSDQWFVQKPRPAPRPGPIRILSVGTMEQLYKGQDVLIDAFAECIEQGLNAVLVLVGDGKYRQFLEERAIRRGVSGQVQFLGWLPGGESVRMELDSADLFVSPSRQEGVPRAMIEAMARGLPCIGSLAGGTPELLSQEFLVPLNERHRLAAEIMQVAANPVLMETMSAQNLARAKEYRDSVLRERRVAFYRYVKSRTEEWLRNSRDQVFQSQVQG